MTELVDVVLTEAAERMHKAVEHAQVEFAGVVLGESHRCLGSVSGQFTAPFMGAGRGLRRTVGIQCWHV